jgi:hypothetical protein
VASATGMIVYGGWDWETCFDHVFVLDFGMLACLIDLMLSIFTMLQIPSHIFQSFIDTTTFGPLPTHPTHFFQRR